MNEQSVVSTLTTVKVLAPSAPSIKAGQHMATRLFATLRDFSGPDGAMTFTEEHIADLLAISIELGRRAALHDAYCVKGRLS